MHDLNFILDVLTGTLIFSLVLGLAMWIPIISFRTVGLQKGSQSSIKTDSISVWLFFLGLCVFVWLIISALKPQMIEIDTLPGTTALSMLPSVYDTGLINSVGSKPQSSAQVGLLLIWGLGFFFSATRLSIGWWKMRKRLHHTQSLTDFSTGCTRLDARLSRHRPRLRISDCASGPYMFGLKRPFIVLPSNFIGYSDEEKRALVAHELAHITRHDYLKNIFLEIARCVFWFNPFFHYLARRYSECREFAADTLVIKWTQDRRALQTAIAKVSLHGTVSQTAISFNGGQNIIADRIRAAGISQNGFFQTGSLLVTLIAILATSSACIIVSYDWLKASAMKSQRSGYLHSAAHFDLDDLQFYVCRQLRQDGIYDDPIYGEKSDPVRLSYSDGQIYVGRHVLPANTQTNLRYIFTAHGVDLKDGYFLNFYSDQHMATGIHFGDVLFGERVGDEISQQKDLS